MDLASLPVGTVLFYLTYPVPAGWQDCRFVPDKVAVCEELTNAFLDEKSYRYYDDFKLVYDIWNPRIKVMVKVDPPPIPAPPAAQSGKATPP